MLAFFLLISFSQLFSQFREYLVEGRIVDPDGQPIAGVIIELQDQGTSRTYSFDSDKKGMYRFVGIPHGRYEVRFSKNGYKPISTEWDLSAPQQRIQKVKMDDAVLISTELLKKIEENRAIKSITDAAKEQFESGDYDATIDLLKDVVVRFPGDIYSSYLIGMAYLAKEEIDLAQSVFTDIMGKDPGFAEAYVQLGFCKQKQKLLPEALELYKEGLKIKPDQFMALYNIGMIHYQLEEPESAISYLEQALKFAQAEVELLETIALCHLQLKRYDKAMNAFNSALEKSTDPDKNAALKEMIDGLKNLKEDRDAM